MRKAVPRIALAGTIVLGCEGDGGLEDSMRSAREPLKNFTDKPFTQFASCQELDSWDGVIDNENVVFPSGCTYKGQIKIMSGDVTLDCNSSTIHGSPDGKVIIDAMSNVPAPDGARDDIYDDTHARYISFDDDSRDPLLAGIIIGRSDDGPNGCRTDGPNVEDVTIRNCKVRGFYQGIRLEREFDQLKPAGGSCTVRDERTLYTGYDTNYNYNVDYDAEYALERSALYDRAPKRVRIIDSTIEKNGHAGIYVIAYSQFFSIEGTTIRNNGSVGIYLSRESRYNTIDRSSIVENGWGSNHSKVNYRVPGVAEVEKKSREGIAIDSSAHNTLSRNRIANNYKGGVFLYKNCGEGSSTASPSLIRKTHADYNRFVHNTIEQHANRTGGSESSGYGIWIAQRQMQAFNELDTFTHCRDPHVVVPGSTVKYNYDYANFNTIAYNSFENNWCSVRVGDDFNQIVGNGFHGNTKYDLYIGNNERGLLGFPVRGTTLVKNTSWSITSNSSGRTIVPFGGSGDTTFFLGEMYNQRRGIAGTDDLHCLDVSDGAPFNHCSRPPDEQRNGVFWD